MESLFCMYVSWVELLAAQMCNVTTCLYGYCRKCEQEWLNEILELSELKHFEPSCTFQRVIRRDFWYDSVVLVSILSCNPKCAKEALFAVLYRVLRQWMQLLYAVRWRGVSSIWLEKLIIPAYFQKNLHGLVLTIQAQKTRWRRIIQYAFILLFVNTNLNSLIWKPDAMVTKIPLVLLRQVPYL